MASQIWLPLSAEERNLLRQALSAYARGEAANLADVNVLAGKIVSAQAYPDITIGVYGGQVQWTAGNPFPLRIMDYDGEKDDLPEPTRTANPAASGSSRQMPNAKRS